MLVPEVEARRALRGRQTRLQVLAPYGAWAGRGSLRVLRVKVDESGAAEVVAGYESYEKLP